MFRKLPYDNRKNNNLIKSSQKLFNIENSFDNFFNNAVSNLYTSFDQMKVDIKENDNKYIVEAELPGVNKEDINIEIVDNRLNISVERDEQYTEEKENYIRKERRYGGLSRSFYIDNIKNDEISANFKNGILTIELPKQESINNGRRKIDIN